MAKFTPHGTLNIRLDGPILVVEGKGPWNLESLNQSGAVVKPFAKQLVGKKWGAIVILHGQAVYVPAAARALTEVVKRDKLAGRIASGVLVDNCESPEFTKEHLSDIYRNAGEQFEFFSDYEIAKSWVLEKLNQSDFQPQTHSG